MIRSAELDKLFRPGYHSGMDSLYAVICIIEHRLHRRLITGAETEEGWAPRTVDISSIEKWSPASTKTILGQEPHGKQAGNAVINP